MTQEHPVRRGQRYNRIILAVFAIGVLSYFVGMAVGRSFAGLVIYAIAGLAGVASLLYLRFGTSVELADEREQRLHERTSGALISLVGYVGLPLVIGLYLLNATEVYVIGQRLWGAITALSVFYLLWGALYLYYRYLA